MAGFTKSNSGRNVTSIRTPKNPRNLFTKAQKGTSFFVPKQIAVSYAQDLLGSAEVPNKISEKSLQYKLDKAFATKVSPWHVYVGKELAL